jgi:hypothetical protein
MQVSVTYEGTTYYLFTGFVTRSYPDLLYKEHVAHITLGDLFFVLDKEEVSVGTQTTKTADELITALFGQTDLTVNDYELDSDPDELKTVVWDNVNVLEKLRTIAEVGQHHHFINGEGKYIFKNNQWLIDNIPKYTFAKVNIDDADIDQDLTTIINKVEVIYNSSKKTASDSNSINRYGLFLYEMDNELQPSAGLYAQAVADHILAREKEPGNTLEFTLRERYPDQFDITFGDRIRFIDADLNIDDIYTVLSITHTITKGGIHEVRYKCKKWVSPLSVSVYYTLEPFTGDTWLDLADATVKIAQSFKVTSNGYPYQVKLNLKHDLDVNRQVRVALYAADGSHFPTGLVLGYSSYVNILEGADSGVYLFEFDENNRPLLVTTSTYCLVLETPQTPTGGIPGSITIVGDSFNPNIFNETSQSFVVPEDLDLESVDIHMTYVLGSPTNLKAYIYNESGDLPTGAALATSDTVTLNGTGDEVVRFTFPTPLTLNQNDKRCLVLDTPDTTLTGQAWRPFVGTQDIKPQDMCINGEVFMIEQRFYMPVNAALIQVDFQITGCAEDAVLQIYQDTTLKATSNPASNGQFVFPAGQQPILSANAEYRLYLVIPVPCRVTDGFTIKGELWDIVPPEYMYKQCVGGLVVGHPWDLDFTLWFGPYTDNTFALWASSANSYSQGRAATKPSGGVWGLYPISVDFAFILNYTSGASFVYVNKWEAWGDNSNPYANGKASEYATSWVTKDPWDFWFSLVVVNA